MSARQAHGRRDRPDGRRRDGDANSPSKSVWLMCGLGLSPRHSASSAILGIGSRRKIGKRRRKGSEEAVVRLAGGAADRFSQLFRTLSLQVQEVS